MRKLVVRLGGFVVAASATLTLASVSPAFASPAAKTVTGPARPGPNLASLPTRRAASWARPVAVCTMRNAGLIRLAERSQWREQ
jgi:hypothetical protein